MGMPTLLSNFIFYCQMLCFFFVYLHHVISDCINMWSDYLGLFLFVCSCNSFQPSRKLAEVYLTVYKLRNRLLAQRNLEFIGARANLSKRSRLVRFLFVQAKIHG